MILDIDDDSFLAERVRSGIEQHARSMPDRDETRPGENPKVAACLVSGGCREGGSPAGMTGWVWTRKAAAGGVLVAFEQARPDSGAVCRGSAADSEG